MNAFYGIIEASLGPLYTLIVSPLLFNQLGTSEFGKYTLIIGFSILGSLFNLGLPQLIFFKSTDLLNKSKSTNKYNHELITAVSVMTVGMTIGVLIILALWYVTIKIFSHVLSFSINLQELAIIILLIICQEFDGFAASIIKANNLFNKNLGIELSIKILQIFFVIMGVYLNYEMYSFLILLLNFSLLKLILKLIVLTKIINYKNLPISSVNFYTVIKILKQSGWLWFQSLSGIMLSGFDRPLVAYIFGVQYVGIYGICLSIAQLIHLTLASAFQFLVPKFKKIISRNHIHHEEIHQILIYSTLSSLLMGCVFYLISPNIMELWMGEVFSKENSKIYRLLIIGYIILSASVPMHYLLLSLERYKYISLSNILAGLLTLLAGLCIGPYGIEFYALAKSIYGVSLFAHFLYYIKNKNKLYS